MEKIGIENIKSLIKASARTATSVDSILSDGKVGVSDLAKLPSLLSAAKGFAEVNYKDIVAEAKDFDDAEKIEIAELLKKELNFENDSVEIAIEYGFEIVLEVLAAVQYIASAGKKIKGD